MPTVASSLVAASAAIPLVLGVLHLLFTFLGSRLHPRDSGLRARMAEVSPVITRQTTVWRCWIGFNATHSLGLILFGAVYGDLALAHGEVLFGSAFLLVLGLLVLLAYAVLAKRYFFRTPFAGVVVATLFYLAALAVA